MAAPVTPETLTPICDAVAKIVGATPDQDQGTYFYFHRSYTLPGSGGQAFIVTRDKNRLQFRAALPYYRGYRPTVTPVITVDSSREPESIARDFNRRFLPDLIAAHASASHQVAKAQDHERRMQETTEAVKSALIPLGARDGRLTAYRDGNGSVSARVDAPESVTIEFRYCTQEQALRLLAAAQAAL